MEISGYRVLSEEEVKRVNAVKAMACDVGSMIDVMQGTPGIDQRWVSIARTHLQEGFMAAVRAITMPRTF